MWNVQCSRETFICFNHEKICSFCNTIPSEPPLPSSCSSFFLQHLVTILILSEPHFFLQPPTTYTQEWMRSHGMHYSELALCLMLCPSCLSMFSEETRFHVFYDPVIHSPFLERDACLNFLLSFNWIIYFFLLLNCVNFSQSLGIIPFFNYNF